MTPSFLVLLTLVPTASARRKNVSLQSRHKLNRTGVPCLSSAKLYDSVTGPCSEAEETMNQYHILAFEKHCRDTVGTFRTDSFPGWLATVSLQPFDLSSRLSIKYEREASHVPKKKSWLDRIIGEKEHIPQDLRIGLDRVKDATLDQFTLAPQPVKWGQNPNEAEADQVFTETATASHHAPFMPTMFSCLFLYYHKELPVRSETLLAHSIANFKTWVYGKRHGQSRKFSTLEMTEKETVSRTWANVALRMTLQSWQDWTVLNLVRTTFMPSHNMVTAVVDRYENTVRNERALNNEPPQYMLGVQGKTFEDLDVSMALSFDLMNTNALTYHSQNPFAVVVTKGIKGNSMLVIHLPRYTSVERTPKNDKWTVSASKVWLAAPHIKGHYLAHCYFHTFIKFDPDPFISLSLKPKPDAHEPGVQGDAWYTNSTGTKRPATKEQDTKLCNIEITIHEKSVRNFDLLGIALE